jgi:hypothetical protein
MSVVGGPGAPEGELDRALCRAFGVNQNFLSSSGTPCHVQVEDYGPVVDRVSEQGVRRVNVIVYANYGTPAARIVFGRDYDYPDVRTRDYNQTIKDQMHELVAQAQAEAEEMEQRELTCMRAWFAGREQDSDQVLAEEFREFAELYPSVFKRALGELRAGRMPKVAPTPVPAATVYPMDAERRRRVIEIEGVIARLGDDLLTVTAQGGADDLLTQRASKLVDKARETLAGRHTGDIDLRLLDLTLDNLAKVWRQVRSRLKPEPAPPTRQ